MKSYDQISRFYVICDDFDRCSAGDLKLFAFLTCRNVIKVTRHIDRCDIKTGVDPSHHGKLQETTVFRKCVIEFIELRSHDVLSEIDMEMIRIRSVVWSTVHEVGEYGLISVDVKCIGHVVFAFPVHND